MKHDSKPPVPEPETGPLEPAPEPLDVPRGVRAMALVRWLLVLVMALVAVGSVAYSFGLVSTESASAADTLYHCPMHPQVVQDHPGDCPICGMTLVKFEAQDAIAPAASASPKQKPDEHRGHRHDPDDPYACPMHPEETGLDAKARCPICNMFLEKRTPQEKSTATAAPPPEVPGLVPVELSLERVQLIGVRTEPARTAALTSELKTVGFVTADEARIARVHARFSGWIERLAVGTTGQKVHRGQALAALYNLELLPAQQEFLAARRWASRAGELPETSGLGAGRLEQDARTRLELFGLSPAEIDGIAASGQPTRAIAVTAPIAGHVTRKNAVQGSYVQPGTELFEIADLSRVWVLADIYEHEIGRVQVGQSATVNVSAYPKAPFTGKVGFIYPALDPGTRTLRVRIELDNKGLQLRPGMFGDVVIELASESGVVVPVDALVDTGELQYVFVAKDGGRFEPRRVQAGARANDQVEIASGLSAGEIVVTTANFLIDSESRLRAAIQPRGSSEADGHSH